MLNLSHQSEDVKDPIFKARLANVRTGIFHGDDFAKNCYLELKDKRIHKVKRSIWINLSQQDLNTLVYATYYWYKHVNGFPYLKQRPVSDLNAFMNLDASTLLREDKIIKQSVYGSRYATSFHPEMYEVEVEGRQYSPVTLFHSHHLFRLITKLFQLENDLSPSSLLRSIGMTGMTQTVSNFKPSVAEYIFRKYSNHGKILTPSEGFSGRLLAALKVQPELYVSNDPSQCTKDGNRKLQSETVNKLGFLAQKSKIVHTQFAYEDFSYKESFDLIGTSPPYFLTEKYHDSGDGTQSHLRYHTTQQWREGFLRKYFSVSAEHLKPDGTLWINIANVAGYPNLENDTLELAEEEGFKLVDTLIMPLTTRMGNRDGAIKINSRFKGMVSQHYLEKFRLEPIFIFKLK